MKRIVVIGGGHAGVEAAVAASSLGASVTLITPVVSRIALMSCNPSLGGIAKGTLVREIDSMGGVTAISADRTALQFRMLNMKKGPAVWGPRVQTDVQEYCREQRNQLTSAGVSVVEDTVISLTGPTDRIAGVRLKGGREIQADGFVLATGTFLGGILHRGQESWPGGRRGDISADALEKDIRRRMFHVKRFKTGTSPRIVRRSVDTSMLEEQKSSEMLFSFSLRSGIPVENTEKCWITRTTARTEGIVKDSLIHSPLYSGRITGKGPRYCPSFEDKVTKFPERTGHPLHLEPMGRGSRIMYLNGLSTSLPEEIQDKVVRSLPGFQGAEIAAYGYSVEYTCFDSTEYTGTLRLRKTENVYVAGQILGTSGYEEAAATGLLAGANAARRAMCLSEAEPDRMGSYLGVMVNDLVTTGAEEPYRLFSSRSENRLHLRLDNADRRLWKLGEALGTLKDHDRKFFSEREQDCEGMKTNMRNTRHGGSSVAEMARRPGTDAETLAPILGISSARERALLQSAIMDMKYEGYITRAERRQHALSRYHDVSLESVSDYFRVSSLSIEAAQALNRIRPATMGEAGGISAVRRADMEALMLHLMKRDVPRGT